MAGAFALLLLGACEKRKSAAVMPVHPTTVQSAPVTADAQLALRPDAVAFNGEVAAICAVTRQLIERAIRCAPDSADMLRDTQRSLDVAQPADAPLSARERWAAICAGIAKAYDEQLAGSDSACRLTVDERINNDAFLAAYYGRRTTARPTGDASVDTSLAELGAARDVLCARTDDECVRAAHKVVTAAVKPIPREMTDAMESSAAIIDEVSRCADRIEQDVARSRW